MIKNTDGEKILLLPNGQKEIHTKDHKVILLNYFIFFVLNSVALIENYVSGD